MIIIAGMNQYLDLVNRSSMNIRNESEASARGILQIMMTEEKYINSGDEKLLSRLEEYRKNLERGVAGIHALSGDGQIKDLAGRVQESERKHAATFALVAKNPGVMNQAKMDFFAGIKKTNGLLKKIVDAIEKEAALLFTRGDFLSMDKSGLRKEIKDLVALRNDNMVNVQELFLYGDPEKFKARNKEIEKQIQFKSKNTQMMLSTINVPEFSQIWGDVQSLSKPVMESESLIFRE